jgi:hypothetical protein
MKPKGEDEPWVDITLEVTPRFVAAAERLRAKCEALNLDFNELMVDLVQISASRIEGQLALRGIKGENQK